MQIFRHKYREDIDRAITVSMDGVDELNSLGKVLLEIIDYRMIKEYKTEQIGEHL